MHNIAISSGPNVIRGLTTWGIQWGRACVLFRWNMPLRQYPAHRRLLRGRFTVVEAGPLLIQW